MNGAAAAGYSIFANMIWVHITPRCRPVPFQKKHHTQAISLPAQLLHIACVEIGCSQHPNTDNVHLINFRTLWCRMRTATYCIHTHTYTHIHNILAQPCIYAGRIISHSMHVYLRMNKHVCVCVVASWLKMSNKYLTE